MARRRGSARSRRRTRWRHAAAAVGLTRPERLAEGAAIGRPAARSSACATGWAGARSARVSSPALASSETPLASRRRSTRLNGPGQNRSIASRRAFVDNRQRRGFGQTGDMHDQRVEARPPLCGEDARDRQLRSSRRHRARKPSRSGKRRGCRRAAVARRARLPAALPGRSGVTSRRDVSPQSPTCKRMAKMSARCGARTPRRRRVAGRVGSGRRCRRRG